MQYILKVKSKSCLFVIKWRKFIVDHQFNSKTTRHPWKAEGNLNNLSSVSVILSLEILLSAQSRDVTYSHHRAP